MRARGRAAPEPTTEAALRKALDLEIESHLARAGVRDHVLLDRIANTVDGYQSRRDHMRRTRAAISAMHTLVSIFTDIAEGAFLAMYFADQAVVVALRGAYERQLAEILSEGVAEGEFEADLDTIASVFRCNGWIDVEVFALDRITDLSVASAGGPVQLAAWLVAQVTGVSVTTLHEHRDYRRSCTQVVDTLRPALDVDVFAFAETDLA